MNRRLGAAVWLEAMPEAVFDHLDDQTRLAAHMARSSAMMVAGRKTYTFDEAKGQAVGSHITMRGSAFGLSLFVDEVVTLRGRPWSKYWKTVGPTRLLILSAYRMGFDIAAAEDGCRLSVWIDYDPPKGLQRILGVLPGGRYARWCVGRIAHDAVNVFAIQRERSLRSRATFGGL